MDSVREKAFAKINLTLHVTGAYGGYHILDSLVTDVDLYDTVTVKKRRDKLIKVNMRGMGLETLPDGENNTYRAAELFARTFSTGGADIEVCKNIPVGAGLGGSSADAAGVLNALAKLYKITDTATLKQLADSCGSDTRYMLGGGYARLFGRGNEVKPVKSGLKLNFLLLVPDVKISSAQCYRAFDRLGRTGGDSNVAERALVSGDRALLASRICNALTVPALSLSGEIWRLIQDLKGFCPLAVNMTGSGSGVYALFENAEYCEYAKSRYTGTAKAYVLKTPD